MDVPKLLNSFFNDFEDMTNDFIGRVKGDVGRANVKETPTSYNIEVLMPGAVKENIEIDVTENVLSIGYKNEMTNETVGDYVRKEWSYSEFNRQFALPENVDADSIVASYDNGVLTLSVNKKQPVAKPSNRIEIK